MNVNQQMAMFYVNMFTEKGEESLRTICVLDVPSKVLLQSYKYLPPIETLPEKDKAELKAYVIDLFPGRNVSFLMNAARIVYCIGNLI